MHDKYDSRQFYGLDNNSKSTYLELSTVQQQINLPKAYSSSSLRWQPLILCRMDIQLLRTAAKGRLGLQSGIVYYRSTRYGVRQVVAQGTNGKRRNKQKYMNRIVCLAKLSLR